MYDNKFVIRLFENRAPETKTMAKNPALVENPQLWQHRAESGWAPDLDAIVQLMPLHPRTIGHNLWELDRHRQRQQQSLLKGAAIHGRTGPPGSRHLPGGPVGPPSRLAVTSNVEVGQTTYPVNRRMIGREGRKGSEGRSRKEEERERGSGTGRGTGALSWGGRALFAYYIEKNAHSLSNVV